MKFAYADPPYLGCCGRYQHFHPDGRCWDLLETHSILVLRLRYEYPHGWALSTSSSALKRLLAMDVMPEDVRIGAWVKPFASFKPNVNPAYAWEPVLFWGGRKRGRYEPTARDWHSESITLKRGLTGAKPKGFGQWIAEILGVTESDTIDDLFPGTGSVAASWGQGRLAFGQKEAGR